MDGIEISVFNFVSFCVVCSRNYIIRLSVGFLSQPIQVHIIVVKENNGILNPSMPKL